MTTNNEEYEDSVEPLFNLYFKQVLRVELKKGAVIVVLQNNCKPCSFESLKFTNWACDSVLSEKEKYVLLFAKSDLTLNCNNIFKDTIGYYQSYGLYSFYDKLYVLENNKLKYSNDIKTENIYEIKNDLSKMNLLKK